MSMTPFSTPDEKIPRCILGANLVILVQIHYKISSGQAKFPRILSQNGQTDLENQSQWPLYSIPVESIPRCMVGANLVIPAQICDELSCEQARVYGQTDGRTDRPTGRRRQRQYPFGLNDQVVKTDRHFAGPTTVSNAVTSNFTDVYSQYSDDDNNDDKNNNDNCDDDDDDDDNDVIIITTIMITIIIMIIIMIMVMMPPDEWHWTLLMVATLTADFDLTAASH